MMRMLRMLLILVFIVPHPAFGSHIMGTLTQDGLPLVGVPVTLSVESGTAIGTKLSDKNGQYKFERLASDAYVAKVMLQEKGYANNPSLKTNLEDAAIDSLDLRVDSNLGRKLGQNMIIGRKGEQVDTWLGVPYAASPTGDLRWRAPRPVGTWRKPYAAVSHGSDCPQQVSRFTELPVSYYGQAVGDEDCLSLNIYAPQDIGKKPLPVMFWIHGGGNTIGSSRSYDGSVLAKMRNVIIVTANYRLGPFAWLRHPALDRGSLNDKAGNFGTQDLILALKWVGHHIGTFGGDHRNITVFGESAGGSNVLSLLASPQARGLFQQAIVQSGSLKWATKNHAQNDKDQGGHKLSGRELVAQLLLNDKLAKSRKEAIAIQNRMTADKIRNYLGTKNFYDLMQAYPKEYGAVFRMPTLVRDGHILPDEDPIKVFQQGRYQKVPVILGSNRDEMKLFMFKDPEFVHNHQQSFSPIKDPVYYEKASYYASKGWTYRGVDQIAQAMHKNQPGQVYTYRFDWDEEISHGGVDFSKALGAAHALEIDLIFMRPRHFLFSRLGFLANNKNSLPGRQMLSQQMSRYFTDFARFGSPGGGVGSEMIKWQPWNAALTEPSGLIFDTVKDGGVRMANMRVDYQKLKEKLQNEQGFPGREQKCSVYLRTFGLDPFSKKFCMSLF